MKPAPPQTSSLIAAPRPGRAPGRPIGPPPRWAAAGRRARRRARSRPGAARRAGHGVLLVAWRSRERRSRSRHGRSLKGEPRGASSGRRRRPWRIPARPLGRSTSISFSARCRVKGGHPTWWVTTATSRRPAAASASIVATKLGPPGPNSHAGADDHGVIGRGVEHRALARQLGPPVGRDRRRRIGSRRTVASRRAVEHVVGRDLDELRPQRRERAAARYPAPAPLTRERAAGSSASAPSTSVHAAQLTITSGALSATARSTARRSLTSSWARARPAQSWPCARAAATTSRPSIPPAPVTSSRIRGPGPRSCRRA